MRTIHLKARRMHAVGLCLALAIAPSPARCMDVALVIKPESNSVAASAFEEALQGLREELAVDDLIVQVIPVSSQATVAQMRAWVYTVNPDVIILMDNRLLGLYRQFQQSESEKGPFPPAVALMAVYVDQLIDDMDNVAAIRYEVQGLTSLVNLRALVNRDLRRIGVIYRPGLRSFFLRQKAECRSENFELEGIEISLDNGGSARKVRRALSHLIDKKKVEALWILNDPILLQDDLLTDGWIPKLSRCGKPVLVGVGTLVESGVGHFAVVPDHRELGAQAADLVREIRANDWRVAEPRARAPISVYKMLNLTALMETARIDPDKRALMEVDEIIE